MAPCPGLAIAIDRRDLAGAWEAFLQFLTGVCGLICAFILSFMNLPTYSVRY